MRKIICAMAAALTLGTTGAAANYGYVDERGIGTGIIRVLMPRKNQRRRRRRKGASAALSFTLAGNR